MTKTLLNRIPPHSIEMETALLSAIFMNNKGLKRIGDLTPDDFYKGAHSKIFSAMLELRKAHQPVDLLTVSERLKDKNEYESVGGATYLSSIANDAPVAINAHAYAQRVKDLAVVRSGIQACMGIIDQGYETNDPDSFIDQAQKLILSLQTTTTQDKAVSLDDLCIRGLDRIKRIQSSTISPGLNFGFPVLGNAMNVSGSKLLILAARPGMGKTALMLSVAKFLGLQGIQSTILSLEMDADELTDRFFSEESDINNLCFYQPGMLTEKSMDDLETAAGNLSHLPIRIDDSECRKIEDIDRKCRKAKKAGSQIIFIDQLSKIPYPKNMSQHEGYTLNCNRIAQLKKELRIPIMLLCQLNRDLEKRYEKIPTLSDLKQTGAIEEDADIILFIYRPGYYEALEKPGSNPDQSRTHIVMAKNRNGGIGVEKQVLFNARRGMFNLGKPVSMNNSRREEKAKWGLK